MFYNPRINVGYAQSELKNGATMVTAQFVSVNGEDMPLENFVPMGEDLSDNVAIQTLDASGKTVDNYLWNDWMYDTACWVDDEFNAVEGVTFASGQGLWVFGSSSMQGIRTAGEVAMSDISVQLKNGATATGIAFPVSIALQDIIPEGDDLSDNVAIQTLDASGKTVDNYLWNDWMYDTACWVDDEFNMVEGVTFAPGQGLWVYGSSNTQYLRIPAPEL